MSAARALVDVRGLAAGYAPGTNAISEVEFTARAGELCAVLGPNGGGKTTLFRALLSEVPERRGRVGVAGPIAYVPQTERSRLDFPVNAIDVVLMGTYGSLPWFRRLGSRERAAARTALERVGLAGEERAPYGSLSGGQRQRVLIARALAQEAEILLLDEPLSGVDQPAAERVLEILDDLRASGHAILLATHDIEQARQCDAVLCLNHRQIAFGEPQSTLSADVLRRTYGGEQAVVVQHHAH